MNICIANKEISPSEVIPWMTTVPHADATRCRLFKSRPTMESLFEYGSLAIEMGSTVKRRSLNRLCRKNRFYRIAFASNNHSVHCRSEMPPSSTRGIITITLDRWSEPPARCRRHARLDKALRRCGGASISRQHGCNHDRQKTQRDGNDSRLIERDPGSLGIRFVDGCKHIGRNEHPEQR